MFISLLAAVFLLWQFPNSDHFKIWIENNELWIQTTGRPRQITHHGRAKGEPAISPDHRRIVYLADQPKTDENLSGAAIIETDIQGKTLRTLTPEGYVPGPYDRLEWIDNVRVGAMTCGHANCWYWVLNADTGKTLKIMQGGFDFVWSHNAQWVARRFVAELEISIGQPLEEDDSLVIDDTQYYPLPGSADALDSGAGPRSLPAHTHVFGSFVWSPNDNWVSFTDTVSPQGDPYLVLVSTKGKVLHETVSTDVGYDTKVNWVDDNTLEIVIGNKTFKFAVRGDQLVEITPQ
jgi:hypothetical protein